MASNKKDFYGKEVADAIKSACNELQVPQEQLEIEVVETGSTGIFGLIRKKAHITASVKTVESPKKAKKKAKKAPPAEKIKDKPPASSEKTEDPASPPEEKAEEAITIPDAAPTEEDQNKQEENGVEEPIVEEIEELPDSALEIIKQELTRLLELMGYPSTVTVSAKGSSVFCQVNDEHEEILTGQDGKTLDSIQYLLRKIIARKVPNRLRLTVDIGNYREKRLEQLKDRAAELAEKVKADGKTQVIAALSPSERRVVHMSLQDDKEIRSRSVGDGLFKKILIYKPGKGGKSSGRKRNTSRGRKGASNRKNNK